MKLLNFMMAQSTCLHFTVLFYKTKSVLQTSCKASLSIFILIVRFLWTTISKYLIVLPFLKVNKVMVLAGLKD